MAEPIAVYPVLELRFAAYHCGKTKRACCCYISSIRVTSLALIVHLKIDPMQTLLRLICVSLLCLAGCESSSTPETASGGSDTNQTTPTDRSFELTYGAKILDVPAGATVKVWMPVAQTSPQQEVKLVAKATPADLQINPDAYSNQIGYFEVKQTTDAAEIDFSLQYNVTRQQAGLDDSQKTLESSESERFLNANRLVPKTGKPIELLADKSVPEDLSLIHISEPTRPY